MNDNEMHLLLLKVLETVRRVRDDSDHEQFAKSAVSWIHTYGGDSTCRLIEHYKDNLESEIRKVL